MLELHWVCLVLCVSHPHFLHGATHLPLALGNRVAVVPLVAVSAWSQQLETGEGHIEPGRGELVSSEAELSQGGKLSLPSCSSTSCRG